MLDYIGEDFSNLFIKGLVVEVGNWCGKKCIVVRYNVKFEKMKMVYCVLMEGEN